MSQVEKSPIIRLRQIEGASAITTADNINGNYKVTLSKPSFRNWRYRPLTHRYIRFFRSRYYRYSRPSRYRD